MTKTTTKNLARALACGLFLTALAGWFRVAAVSQQLPENVLRLHVVANSDSSEDQALKLAVRDAVLAQANRWCQNAATMEEANAQVCLHLEGITQAAEEVVKAQGFPYPVKAQVGEMYFPTRQYQDFALPAGRYRALRVTIGQGKGKNWWCMVFPALCLPAAQGQDVLGELPQQQREVAEHPGRYRVGLKVTELYEQVKNWLAGGM